jgi:hypothetical protein
LSTTSTPVDGLDPTLADNIGPNNTVVFAGSLPSVSGEVLRFLLSTPFTYDPTQGNLLINVSSADADQPGPNFFFDTNGFPVPNNGIFSRGYDTPAGVSINTGYGLVPVFRPAPCPNRQPGR